MTSKLPTFESPFESYSATSVIGEGGAGRVYKTTNSSGKVYAIKCLVPERLTRERLKNEINFCQTQRHANIVRIIDTGSISIKDAKCPFYVMQLYSGTLRTYMENAQPEKILEIFSQILNGIETAHLLKVFHRDIKPENILWDKDNNSFAIADFGIAHFEENEIYTAIETKVTSRMANFKYSAPEQRIKGSIVDHRADIFSLGLILNELFTAEIPQGTGYKRITQVSEEHGYLDPIVDSMIQQNPENRPSSIGEIKKELIGHKNEFIALQRLEETKKQVVSSSKPPEFEPITITSLDYENGTLTLILSNNVPPGWAQCFRNPRGGHSSIMGYGPEYFQISGNKASIGLHNNENIVQQIVDHAKNYISSANSEYLTQLKENALKEEKSKRLEYERKVQEAELKKNILSKVKL